jgi:Fe-S-cluster formation regulator IscX/YfhJ
MKKKETKESSYLAIINDLSEDIGISTEETKSLVDVALSSTDPRNVNFEQLKQEITTFLFINIFFLICKL